ncbi:MAG: CHAT domain-containing protein [Saprospiraceae bacterium]|nr:CHAT domain-containing protein [Saprospiraceae bacterium]
MTTLKDLEKIKKLTQRHDDGAITAVRLVKGYNDSYALNTEGGITALSLSDSSLESFALDASWQDLEYLYLSGNQSLKKVVFHTALPKLTHLYLNNCALEEITIPAGCKALQQIYVQKNQLKKIVFEGDCPELVLVDASENPLVEFRLPTIFPKMAYLYLVNVNTLANIPKEVYADKKNCWQDVSNYLRASLQSGNVLNDEAKCIFFGNGRAGKTTLSHQLRTGQFDPTIKYTHGILIEEWRIGENDFPQELSDKIEAVVTKHQAEQGEILERPRHILLNMWDFGGQEYFHATHRLFLNSNVLYMLVWEKATNEQNEEKGDYPEAYWQNNIKHYAPKNITLTIQNKEKGSTTVDYTQKRYKIAERNAKDTRQYDLDAQTLKEAICKNLIHLEYLCAPIPKLYDDIRQELKRLKKEKPYLRFDEYKAICQRLDKTADSIMQNEGDIESLTKFLHDIGVLICYRYDSQKKNNSLDDYVFINPQWVTETIYHILDEKTLAGKGEFDIEHVAQVLKASKNVIQEAEVWIDLMTVFELIFKKRDTATQFVTPQYLPQKCTDLSEKAWRHLNNSLPYKLILRYPHFLPKSIISRFICHYGDLAQDYYWKYGIVIHQEGKEVFVHCDYTKREIILQTHEPLSDIAIQLFDTLRGIDNTDSLEVAVPDSKDPRQMLGFVNFKKLKERIEKGKTDVEWQGQEFETEPFKALLGREHIRSEVFDRGLGFTKKGDWIDNTKPIIVPMVSDARTFQSFKNIKETIKLLFLSATPMKAGKLNTGKESRFKDLFRYFDTEKRFILKEEHGITTEEFQNFVIYENPHIVHYGGHGKHEGIVLEDENLEADILSGILQLSENVQCVVLNACNSLAIAKELAQYIPYVIGTQHTIDDGTAIAFAKGFYMGIVSGKTIEQAFQLGLLAVKREKLPDADVLVLVKGQIQAES